MPRLAFRSSNHSNLRLTPCIYYLLVSKDVRAMEIMCLPARAGRYFSTPCRVINESNQLEKSFRGRLCNTSRSHRKLGAAGYGTSACRLLTKLDRAHVSYAQLRAVCHALRFVRVAKDTMSPDLVSRAAELRIV